MAKQTHITLRTAHIGDLKLLQHRAIDIWIGNEKDLGKGYGTIMMKLALERCFSDDKVTSVLIDPLETNQGAIRFYERIGFQLVEQRTFEESRCLVYKLGHEDWMKTNCTDQKNIEYNGH